MSLSFLSLCLSFLSLNGGIQKENDEDDEQEEEAEEEERNHVTYTQTRATNSLRFYLAHTYTQHTAPFNVKTTSYILTDGQHKRRVLQWQSLLSLLELSEKFVLDCDTHLCRSLFFESTRLSVDSAVTDLFLISTVLVHLRETRKINSPARDTVSIVTPFSPSLSLFFLLEYDRR